MSKPDWKDAPEWAQWLAMDACGCWQWFSKKPYIDIVDESICPIWHPRFPCKFSFCDENFDVIGSFGVEIDSWKSTLERRP